MKNVVSYAQIALIKHIFRLDQPMCMCCPKNVCTNHRLAFI